jgi:murein DD-endopeptidase MepM/ murein hydrolase activator NlpD
MKQYLNKTYRAIKRWIKRERKGRFSQSTAFTLITRPLWQYDRIKAWMGAPIVAALVIGVNTTQMPANDILQGWDVSQPVTEITGFSVQLQTDHTYLVPVTPLTGISQYFHQGHPGIDFRAPLGTDVVAMDDITVTKIIEERYGYGRHVYVEQGDGKVALYAHLGLIMVETGDKIKAGDVIGEIGMTGWTTGPHLHFEVRHEGAAINPIPMLSKALAAR